MAPFNFLLALNFFSPKIVSCRWKVGATRCRCYGDEGERVELQNKSALVSVTIFSQLLQGHTQCVAVDTPPTEGVAVAVALGVLFSTLAQS